MNKHKKKVRLRQGLTKIEFENKYKNYPLRYYKKTFFINRLTFSYFLRYYSNN